MSVDRKEDRWVAVVGRVLGLLIVVGAAILAYWLAGVIADGTNLLNQPAWLLLIYIALAIVIQPTEVGKSRDPRTGRGVATSIVSLLGIAYFVILTANS